MDTPHINPGALAALLDRWPASDASVAAGTGITPGHLGDLKSGRRSGKDSALRERLAATIGVHPDAIACWCDRPSRHRDQRVKAAA